MATNRDADKPAKKSRKKQPGRKQSKVLAFDPGPDVKILGKQVIADPETHKAFRKKATVAGQFANELKKHKETYQQLNSDADIAFCEGWLHLARLEFGDNPDLLDHHIVVRLKAALYHDGPDIVSG